MTPDQHWARPAQPCGTGVLVLAGSSGRVDGVRADRLARAGATALAIRWFGGRGQPAVPCEVALETFTSALDRLAGECDRLAVVGLSYGAEAALLTAVEDPRLAAVVALAPTDVAWEGAVTDGAGRPRSKWTRAGAPLPFVPLDRGWVPTTRTPAYVDLYRRSRSAAGEDVVAAATIPVERIGGEVVVVAGGDDRVWPSLPAARSIAARRRAHGRTTTLVEDPVAGHQVRLPGEVAVRAERPYAVGGEPDGPRRLGAAAWPEVAAALSLDVDR